MSLPRLHRWRMLAPLALALGILAGLVAPAFAETVRYGIDPAWYPLEYRDAQGRHRGMTADYLADVARRTGLDFELVPTQSWAETLAKLERGEIDMILAGGASVIRARGLLGTVPYFDQLPVVVVQAGAPHLKDLDDVRGKIAVQSDSSAHYWLMSLGRRRAILPTANASEAVRAVAAGQAEAAVLSAAVAAHLAQTTFHSRVRILTPPSGESTLSMAVRAGRADLLPVLNRALSSLEEAQHARIQAQSGVAERIMVEMPWRSVLRRAGPPVAALVLLLSLFVYWNRRLAQARRAADGANLAKSRYLAVMGHELRTPLSGAISTLELLQRKTGDQGHAGLLGNVLTLVRHQLTMIDDLIDMEKASTGHLCIKPEPCDLGRELEAAVALFQPHAEQKRIHLAYHEITPLPAMLEIDGARVRQILHNLLNNAFRFTDTGSVTVAVSTARENGKDVFTMSVADTGVGIPAEKVELVLQPFVQAHQNSPTPRGGSGLGLAICRQLAHLMGGWLRLTSTEHVGTRVTLSVPFVSRDTALHPVLPLAGRRVGLDKMPNVLEQRISKLLLDAGATVSAADDEGLDAQVTAAPSAQGGLLLSILAGRGDARAQCAGAPLFLPRTFIEQCVYVSAGPSTDASDNAVAREPKHRAILQRRRLPNMLLVEDDPFLREVMRQQLAELALDVEFAADGNAALDAWRARRHDLVLTDINVPGRNGIALATELRKAHDGVDKPLVIIGQTADTDPSTRQHAQQAGMQELLLKPVRNDDVCRVIQRYFPA
ncbi:transporter substrate-binding domain-containing protein [Pandoraea sp.]|uniref:ATP-binding protein n=1 Tax=Pandoraea sp. TaxID=1883445 RepID=UPI00120E88DE|nr:transporter substrate-binding domain-containing protein [Pandoraea sp.]TAL53587.1 MAG: transporter substrate-binding domain-containing protein [Pandoraea sp.]TAM14870.1 MAG: transporter substrate-binding domain-containing protein [Pandoraea sp.]